MAGAEVPITNRSRKAARALNRERVREEKAREAKEEATAELERYHAEAEARFGRDIPRDALLLDVLESITVEDGDFWRWHGQRNNHGVPQLRVERWTKSLARYLAIAFGVIGEEDNGLMYPLGDAEDMNPWHREFRRAPAPVGHASRFGYAWDAPDDQM